MAEMKRVEQHGKISAGDTVKVRGHRGTFVVKYIDQFPGKRLAEVTVVGGSAGHSAWRTFVIDRVKPIPKRRVRSA
jgi:Na+-transporting NADH:ubiquinone oxidoreductase subunit NqrF